MRTRRRRAKPLAYFGDSCIYCGLRFRDDTNPHIDHMVPRSRGGVDEPFNKVLSCAYCNVVTKGARLPNECFSRLSANAERCLLRSLRRHAKMGIEISS